MNFNDVILYIIIPIFVAIFSSSILAVFHFLKPHFFKEHLVIKELKSSADNDINEFVKLYNDRISEKLRICAEQIVEFTDNNFEDGIEHHLIVCKHKETVVGFIKVIVSEVHHFIFIAYIAIDKTDHLALKYGVSSLACYVLKKYFRKNKHIDNIFTEIERTDTNGIITPLYKNIGRRSKNFELNSYLINFDYIQPNMPDDNYNSTNEDILSLIWIPKNKPTNNELSKQEVIDFCKNIYNDIYLPSCKETNCSDNYTKYLNSLYLKYNESLCDKIKIINMVGE